MISFLAKKFIPNHIDYKNADVRRKYGLLCSGLGIALNLFLFAAKLTAGLLSKSMAITADAFNNLSDGCASVIAIIGFKLSGRKPDANHPFGHGRVEYISGLIVSFLILLLGFELLTSSVRAVFSPTKLDITLVTAVILPLSVAVKFYMYLYNHSIAQKTGSPTLDAIAKDSLGDMVSTSIVLVSTIVAIFLPKIPIDGITGIFVAFFILKSGFESITDTIDPLLGVPPEKEFIHDIEKFVLETENIHGIHDLIIHDYGPGRKMISLHAEIDGHSDVFKAHEIIDDLELRLSRKFDCNVNIHMDPIDTKNPEIPILKDFISKAAREIHQDISIHDLRTVPGENKINVIFDAVRPYECHLPDPELRKIFREKLSSYDKKYHAVVNIDDTFV